MKKIITTITLFIALFTTVIQAQSKDTLMDYPDLQKRELEVLRQQWSVTNNSSGMAFSPVGAGSFATLGVYSQGGDHHRIQEGSAQKGLYFSTERYDKFNDKIHVKGSFKFKMDKEFDRGWSDVFKTYNSNPYIFGSSVRGNYDTQSFDLKLQVYTLSFGRFNMGLTIDYLVADMARQRDPRSRSYLLDYSLIPSLVYNINDRHKLGLNLYYRYDKEKMPGLTTVQTDPNLQYYTFTGLQNAEGRIGGYRGFSRQFIANILGGDLQYNYNQAGVKWLVSAGMEYRDEETLGDKRQSPGSYNSYDFDIYSDLLLEREAVLHNFKFKAAFTDGGADEFRQRLVSERDTLTGLTTQIWETIYIYKNRFMVKHTELQASWKIFNLRDKGASYNWSAGSYIGFRSFKNSYFLPQSDYSAGRISIGVNGSVLLYDGRSNKLYAEGDFSSGFATGANLDSAMENLITNEILGPDLEFHKKDTFSAGASLKYTFPLEFYQKTKLTGYAKIYGGNIFSTGGAGWYNIGVAIGLLTL